MKKLIRDFIRDHGGKSDGIENPYLPRKLKCTSPYVIYYAYLQRDKSRILNSVPTENGLYTWILPSEGPMKYGRIFDGLEFGASHMMLVEPPNQKVLLAGELAIHGNQVMFNLRSGTYTAAHGFTPAIQTELALEYVQPLFQHLLQNDHVVYQDHDLFPTQTFNPEELNYACNFNNCDENDIHIYPTPQSGQCPSSLPEYVSQKDVQDNELCKSVKTCRIKDQSIYGELGNPNLNLNKPKFSRERNLSFRRPQPSNMHAGRRVQRKHTRRKPSKRRRSHRTRRSPC